jgi:hypothetical protein
MTNIGRMLSDLLKTDPIKPALPAAPPLEVPRDRIDYDLVGVSDADAMWYYERRMWRGRD